VSADNAATEADDKVILYKLPAAIDADKDVSKFKSDIAVTLAAVAKEMIADWSFTEYA